MKGIGMRPEEIQSRSFAIIDAEAGEHGFSSDQWTIVRRMIHTSADFDYLRSVRFSSDAVISGVAAVRAGAQFFTDTEMVRAGIRFRCLERFGGSAICHMADPKILQAARATGSTRARVAVESVADRLNGAIYVVGNAPTALLRLIELIHSHEAAPALVIGLPVGFVNAAESKALLLETAVPFITSVGRKGGSNVAASVVNALIDLAENA